MLMLQGVLGLVMFSLLAWLFSENRRRVQLRVLAVGIALQFVLALLMLKFEAGRQAFVVLNGIVLALQDATMAGTQFVFGFLGGGELPFDQTGSGSSFVLAFRALPLILVISALSSLLFYWKILSAVVRAFAWLLEKSLQIGGALGLGAAANVFVGMIEAPLLIKPYLRHLTRSELFAVMSTGMATIAGTMMVLYAGILGELMPNVLGHIITASIISVPAALMVARVMVPETSTPTPGVITSEDTVHSSIEAITQGALNGLRLLAYVVVMLIVFVALGPRTILSGTLATCLTGTVVGLLT